MPRRLLCLWRRPGVVTSLREGGDERLAFFAFPKVQWKTLRTILLSRLVASGQIKLRRIDGWRKIAAVVSQQQPVAA